MWVMMSIVMGQGKLWEGRQRGIKGSGERFTIGQRKVK